MKINTGKLRLWVWHDVLIDWSSGIVFALAISEAEAWDCLKEADSVAWCTIRDNLGGDQRWEDDKRTPDELPADITRPKEYDSPVGFTCWGGG